MEDLAAETIGRLLEGPSWSSSGRTDHELGAQQALTMDE